MRGMGASRIEVDHAGMAVLRQSMGAVAEGFDVLPAPVRAKADDVVAAAGELGASLAHGAAAFALSWTSALQAYGESCALLGGHVGEASVQMQAIDHAGAVSLRERQ